MQVFTDLCWSTNIGVSRCWSPLENITYELVLTFLQHWLPCFVCLTRIVFRWKVSGCTAIVFGVLLPGLVQNSTKHFCIVPINLFVRVQVVKPTVVLTRLQNLHKFPFYFFIEIEFPIRSIPSQKQSMPFLCIYWHRFLERRYFSEVWKMVY